MEESLRHPMIFFFLPNFPCWAGVGDVTSQNKFLEGTLYFFLSLPPPFLAREIGFRPPPTTFEGILF